MNRPKRHSSALPLAEHLKLAKQKLARQLGVSENQLEQIAQGLDDGWERNASPVLQHFTWKSMGTGRPSRPNIETETQARKEFELRKSGRTYAQIRDALYPNKAVELDAIKQRIRRYAERNSLGPKCPPYSPA